MKDIKGLGERLFGLDHLMRDAKDTVRQQAELAQAFLNVSSLFYNNLLIILLLIMSFVRLLSLKCCNYVCLFDAFLDGFTPVVACVGCDGYISDTRLY